jgi:hypothetical protein
MIIKLKYFWLCFQVGCAVIHVVYRRIVYRYWQRRWQQAYKEYVRIGKNKQR